MGNRILDFHCIPETDIATPHSTQRHPLGMEIVVGDPATLTTFKRFLYILAHGALTQYQPYIEDHNGTARVTAAPATGAGRIVVPQVAFTSGYYGFVLVEGEGTVNVVESTYAVGDHLQVLNAGTASNVDGTSGSTVRTAASFAVSKAAGTTAASISAYLFGCKVDVAAS